MTPPPADLINKSLIEPMNTYDLLNVTDLNTLFEEIPDYPLDVNMNLTNTASVLKKLKSLNPHKTPAVSGPWWYPKLDSSWLCRIPCSLCIGLIEFVLQAKKTALMLETS